MTETIHDGTLRAHQKMRDIILEKEKAIDEKKGPIILKQFAAFTNYLWERLEEENQSPVSEDEIASFLKSIPGCILQVLEDDLRSGVFTPHFQRTVRTAWSDTEQRFVLTSDQGC